jgi:hypothetical protein
VGSQHPFIGPGKERRGQEGDGQVAVGVNLMDFNGETFSHLDAEPRGGESKGAAPGDEVGVGVAATLSVVAPAGSGGCFVWKRVVMDDPRRARWAKLLG